MAFAILVGVVFAAALALLFLNTRPERLAAILRVALPVALAVAGVGLMIAGRGALGVPLVGLAYGAWRRLRVHTPVGDAGGPRVSTVRSRFLEMTLDHDADRMDGVVIEGPMAGALLSELSDADVTDLRSRIAADPESVRLLDAYLDRRIPGWRRDAHADDGDGLGRAPGTGAMTEQEAHEILGLQPGATLAEIREAHRRLMKRVHPDSGGTDFLAARINEAKAFLIDRQH